MTKLALVVLVVAAACGDDGGKGNGGKDAAIDGKTIDAHVADAGIDGPMVDAPPGTVQLTVKNYLAWCDVSVNGGAVSSAAMQTVNVMPGTIPLTATALVGFKLDAKMWHHTQGDTQNMGEAGTVTGTGQSAVSATNAIVGGTGKCVWVCCPFTDGSGCDVADQCP